MGALMLYITAMLTDALDGIIARRFNQITTLGKLLDPVADKLFLLTLLWLFVADGQIPAWLLTVVLIKEAVLIVGSVAALYKGIVVQALPIGKVTTVTFIFSMIARFLSQRTLADILLACSMALSMTALIWYGFVMLKRIKRSILHSEPQLKTV